MEKSVVGISGSYGGLNLGDEAILKSIISQLRSSLPVEIVVFSRNPEHTLLHQEVDRAIPVRALSRVEIRPEIQRLDLFILGGGGLLFDEEADIYLREMDMAHEMGIATMVYAIGAGPLRQPVNQQRVARVFEKTSVVTVREREARKVLEEAGVHCDIRVTADPALLLAPEAIAEESLSKEGLDTKRRLIGFSVREPGPAAPNLNEVVYHSLLANTADYMVDRYNADILFVPMERKGFDLQHSHAVIAQMLRPERAAVLKGDYSPGQLLSLMRYLDFAVGMRLHFLMFAAMQEVPFVALPYASKVTGFLDAFQIESPPVHLVNAGRLMAHIDHSWDERVSLIARIREKLPGLRQLAGENNRLAKELLQNIQAKKMRQGV